MSFLYFIPDRGVGFSLDDAKTLGLDRVLSVSMHHRECDGPAGQHGVIVARSESLASARVGYWPDKQTWRKLPGIEAWAGFETGSPPGPAELVRAATLPGHQLALGDGRSWLVPVAIEASGPPLRFRKALPVTMDVNDAGEWIDGEVLEAYRPLWEIAADWWDARVELAQHVSEGKRDDEFRDERFTKGWIFDSAVDVLAVHYRLGKLEVAMLGLFSSNAGMEVLDYLVDEPGYRAIREAEATQKKTADGSSTGDGPEG